MTYKNSKLYKSIKSYVVAAIDLVSNDLGNKFSADDWFDAPEFPFIHSRDKLKQLSEYKKCLKVLKSDSIIASQFDVLVGTNSGRSRSPKLEELMMRLPHLTIYKNTIKFNEEYFEREYNAFESNLYDENFSYEVIVPLSGPVFKAPIKLSDKLEICQVNKNDLTIPLKNDMVSNDRPYFDQLLWAIRTQYTLPKIIGDEVKPNLEESDKNEVCRNKANGTIEQVLTCLRLLGASNVYPYQITHRTKPWIFHDIRQYSIKYFPATQFSLELEEDFHKVFIKFWETFQKYGVNKHTFIAVATKRYSYAHERYDREDRIIDLLIAAEALFLPKSGGQGELKYRLKLHAAMFLGNDSHTKKQIFDDMSFAYDLRSKIVHGSSDLDKFIKKIENRENIGFGEEYRFDQFIYRIQEYIRVAICKMINIASLHSNQKEIINWDKLILD
jgi:hypothetical protein